MMNIKKSALIVILDNYCCICVTLTLPPNEGVKDVETFVLVFLRTYKRGLLFLYIWSITISQL